MQEYIKKLTRLEESPDGAIKAWPPYPFEMMQKINEVVDYLNSLISVGILPYPDGYNENEKISTKIKASEKDDVLLKLRKKMEEELYIIEPLFVYGDDSVYDGEAYAYKRVISLINEMLNEK